MMANGNTIWKFEVPAVDDTVVIESPCRLVRWLHLEPPASASEPVFLWAEVFPYPVPDDLVVHIRGTGHPMCGNEGEHIGTFTVTVGAIPLVWHVFADKAPEDAL